MQSLTANDPAEVGGYKLRARLGSGGMGRVYLGSTPGGRPVAVKVVRWELSDNPEFRERFRHEVAVAQRVHGLYTAQVIDADPDAEPPWLATAYVPGPSLGEVISKEGALAEQAVFLLIAGLAEALQAIHSAGVIHRDLKPSNVILSPDGPRVIDFGIARALEGPGVTSTGFVGTPHYIAPEQIRHQPGSQSFPMDIFSLGALAAHAALGRPPFGGPDPQVVMFRVLHQGPDLDGCPPRLRALIEACLAKQPSDRPALSEIIKSCRPELAGDKIHFGRSWLPPALADAGSHAAPAPAGSESPPLLASGPQAAAAVVPKRGRPPSVQPGFRQANGQPFWQPAVASLMGVAGALDLMGLITGIAASSALTTMFRHGHPAALAAGVSSAAALAVAVTTVRGLIGAAGWLGLGWQSWQRRRWDGHRTLATAFLIVITAGTADSLVQALSLPPVRGLFLASWACGAIGVTLLWLGRPAPRGVSARQRPGYRAARAVRPRSLRWRHGTGHAGGSSSA